jgi:hypothetical protein
MKARCYHRSKTEYLSVVVVLLGDNSVAYAIVTPELNANMTSIDSFHAGDLLILRERLSSCDGSGTS